MMGHENLRALASKLEKQVALYRRGQQNKVLVLIDNFTILANSCDSDRPQLDQMEFMNHVCAMS